MNLPIVRVGKGAYAVLIIPPEAQVNGDRQMLDELTEHIEKFMSERGLAVVVQVVAP